MKEPKEKFMVKQPLLIKLKNGEKKRYIAVTFVSIWDSLVWRNWNINEPVLYFQQNIGKHRKEFAIPLKDIESMLY